MKQGIERVELSREGIEEALAQAKPALPPEIYGKLETVVRAYFTVVRLLEGKRASIARLRRMIFGPSSEKNREVLGPKERKQEETGGSQARAPKPGHGRNGAAAYANAKTERVPHARLEHGDRCPGCRRGNVYEQKDPGVLVRVTGQTPLNATVYEIEKLRCGACGNIFPARPPKGVGPRKYDERAAAMIALFKYGGGFPFHRLTKLQGCVGIPLPASTQWEIVRDAARGLAPVHEELLLLAAQGKLLHNDDENPGAARQTARGGACARRRAHGGLHHRYRQPGRRAASRSVLHGPQARGREPRGPA